MTQVGLQLHTLRDLDEDLPDVVRQVGEYGFQGVEFASRIREADARAVRTALDDAGIDPVAAHVSLSRLESGPGDLLERYETVGCSRLVIPHLPAEHFLTRDRVDAVAARLTDLADRLDERGFDLLVHNAREMHLPLLGRYALDGFASDAVPVGGWNHLRWGLDRIDPTGPTAETGFRRLVAATDPDRIAFEIDVEHVTTAGRDPSDAFDLVADRLPIVHVSDATRSRRLPPAYQSADLGEGIVDVRGNVRAALGHDVDWLILENDHPAEPGQALPTIAESFGSETRDLDIAGGDPLRRQSSGATTPG